MSIDIENSDLGGKATSQSSSNVGGIHRFSEKLDPGSSEAEMNGYDES
jgi:hypothetical protein